MDVRLVDVEENANKLIKLLNEHQLEEFGNYLEESQRISLAIYQKNTYVGGLISKITGNRMHISLLAIKEEYRGERYGYSLIKEIEKEALQYNCKHLTVNTQEFQGLGFYQRLGFSVLGKIEDCPFEGTNKYYLHKVLEGE